jgi:hypothetical protein
MEETYHDSWCIKHVLFTLLMVLKIFSDKYFLIFAS